MSISKQTAKHLHDVFFGGNWTVSNLKEKLADVTREQALEQVGELNTIAVLTYHIRYFISAALDVLQGRPLTANDKFSFDHPPLNSEQDWFNMQEEIWMDVEELVKLVERLPEERLLEDFADQKYGNYFRNLHGIIEHTHYHLGQISLIKKLIKQGIS